MRGQLAMKENPVYLLWSPITWDQARYEDLDLKGPIEPYLAGWNLNWLFGYEALILIDDNMRAWEQVYKGLNAFVAMGILYDVSKDSFGIKFMAETLTPTEFITDFMKKPYRQTYIYNLCEKELGVKATEELFSRARINAPKLEASMLGEAEIGEDGIPRPVSQERRKVLQVVRQNPNVIAFPQKKKD
jgi:hypothetical protein